MLNIDQEPVLDHSPQTGRDRAGLGVLIVIYALIMLVVTTIADLFFGASLADTLTLKAGWSAIFVSLAYVVAGAGLLLLLYGVTSWVWNRLRQKTTT